MPRKSKTIHIHQFYKIRDMNDGSFVWACKIGGCTFAVYPKQTKLAVLNRWSLCNQCGQKFFMNEDNLLEDIPKCRDCRRGHKLSDEVIQKLDEIIETDALDKYLTDYKNRDTQAEFQKRIIERFGSLEAYEELNKISIEKMRIEQEQKLIDEENKRKKEELKRRVLAVTSLPIEKVDIPKDDFIVLDKPTQPIEENKITTKEDLEAEYQRMKELEDAEASEESDKE